LYFTGFQIGVAPILRFSRVQEITDLYRFRLPDPIGILSILAPSSDRASCKKKQCGALQSWVRLPADWIAGIARKKKEDQIAPASGFLEVPDPIDPSEKREKNKEAAIAPRVPTRLHRFP
jgi:hypothetical protein